MKSRASLCSRTYATVAASRRVFTLPSVAPDIATLLGLNHLGRVVEHALDDVAAAAALLAEGVAELRAAAVELRPRQRPIAVDDRRAVDPMYSIESSFRAASALFKLLEVNLITTLGIIFFLHLISNFFQIESAAFTDICCPIIVLQSEKKGLFLVVKKPLLYFLIIFLNIGSLLERIFLALCQYFGDLLMPRNRNLFFMINFSSENNY